MATPNLTTEVTAFPSFPRKGTFGYSAERLWFEDDASVSYEDTPRKHRRWTLVYENQGDSDLASFVAFFDVCCGKLNTFYWNDFRTGENDIKVAFDQDEVEPQADGARTWSWTVKIRETQ